MARFKNSNTISIAASVAFMLLLPFLLPRTSYYLNILISFCYFAILSSSLNLLLGYTGQISLGHSAFMCVGAYTYAIMHKLHGVPMFIAIVCGIIMSFLFGLVLGIACSRLSAIFLAMTTGALVRALSAFIVKEAWLTLGPNGIPGVPRLAVFGIDKLKVDDYNFWFYFITLGIAILMVIMCYRLVNSRTGRAFQAIKLSPIAASAMAINVNRYKFIVCGISAGMAGVAGIIYAMNVNFIGPEAFNKMSVRILTMCVVGGMGTIAGPLIGAVIIAVLPELLRPVASHLEGVYGVVIIFIFLFMPTGVLGGIKDIAGFIKKRISASGKLEAADVEEGGASDGGDSGSSQSE